MSQLESTKKTIGENNYEVYMLAPTPSHKLFVEVVKMLGPGAGPIMDVIFSDGKIDLDRNVDMGMFSRAMATVCHSLDYEITRKLIEELAKVSTVNGKKLGGPTGVFEAHFAGKMDELYTWLVFAMGVQWGKCIGALMSYRHAEAQTPQQ